MKANTLISILNQIVNVFISANDRPNTDRKVDITPIKDIVIIKLSFTRFDNLLYHLYIFLILISLILI